MADSPFAASPLATPASAPQPGLFDGLFPQQQAQVPTQTDTPEIGEAELIGDAAAAEIPALDQAPAADTAAGVQIAEVPEEPIQVAGMGRAIKRIIKGDSRPKDPSLGDVIDEGVTSGMAGDTVIIREATDDEAATFQSLTGRTEGVPSPTRAQEAQGIPATEFNLQNINGPDDLKRTVDKVSEVWKDAGRAAGRGKMSFDDIQQLAEGLGLDRTVDRLLRRKSGETFNAEEITASLQTIASSGMELDRLAKIAAESTDAQDLLRFRQHLAFQSALITSMKGAQMEAARALGAFRIPRTAGDVPDAARIAGIMEDFGGENSVRDMAKAYLALDSMAKRNTFTAGAWDKAKDAWFEVWINGLLSAPSTITRRR